MENRSHVILGWRADSGIQALSRRRAGEEEERGGEG